MILEMKTIDKAKVYWLKEEVIINFPKQNHRAKENQKCDIVHILILKQW